MYTVESQQKAVERLLPGANPHLSPTISLVPKMEESSPFVRLYVREFPPRQIAENKLQ